MKFCSLDVNENLTTQNILQYSANKRLSRVEYFTTTVVNNFAVLLGYTANTDIEIPWIQRFSGKLHSKCNVQCHHVRNCPIRFLWSCGRARDSSR